MAKQPMLAAEISDLERALPLLPVVVVSKEVEASLETEWHVHDRHQLVYSSKGVMIVQTAEGEWILPPQRAIWMPRQIPHRIIFQTSVSLRNLLILPYVVSWLPENCCIINVTELLRELIQRAAELPVGYAPGDRQDNLMRVLLDELKEWEAVPLLLPQPFDKRLKRVCEVIRADPSDNRTLDEWAREAGASSRTLSRLFKKETGMSFALWRRQARLMTALVLLAQNQSVTSVALDVGYEDTSAFIEMFRRSLGTTPARYFS